MIARRVIICGGRNYGDAMRLFEVMDRLHAERPISVVIHGNARGADSLGGMWAEARKIPFWPVPAQWAKHGKGAGPKRNAAMLGMGVQLVVAFPGGAGTADMVKRATARGVEVISVDGSAGEGPRVAAQVPPPIREAK